MLRYAFSAVLLLFGLGCEKETKLDTAGAFPKEPIAQGVAIISTHCNTCHGVAEREMEDMLAPPLWGVRAHYLKQHPEPEAFVGAIVSFLEEPTRERSLMPKAVEHYGLKAPVSLAGEDMRLAASAIYAGAIERPNWSYKYKVLHEECEADW